MLSPAQHGKLSPVVAAAWKQHCDRNGLLPSLKACNGYRSWYEGVIYAAVKKTSTSEVNTANQFGKVLSEFAQIAGDEALIRRLADDEERRLRWVLRMLCVDLSFLRCEHVGWEYVRGIYGQSKLPPGDFADCPAEYLDKIIPMLDTQIRRECEANRIRKCELPRRAACRNKALYAVSMIARKNGMTTDALFAWHDELLAEAKADLRSGQVPQAQTITSDHTATQGEIPF